MASLREQLVARTVATLTGATPAGTHVFRSRETSITRDVVPAIVVRPESEQSEPAGAWSDMRQLVLLVEIHVRGDPWDQAADAVAEAAHRVLMRDAPLQALANIRQLSTDYESDEADRTAGCLTARYRYSYLSQAADIAAAP